MITQEIIDYAINDLADTKKNYRDITEKLIAAKNALETCRLVKLSTGEIDGKNTEMREASARAILDDEYTLVAKLEEHERATKLDLDLAYLELDRVKMQLRLMELSKLPPSPANAPCQRQSIGKSSSWQ